MVRNLCFSQKYVDWDHFLTFTCNMKTHFGTAPIKEWMDGNEWKNHYPGFYDLDHDEQDEIECAFLESAAGLLLRVWDETFELFIDYLMKSESSPFRKLDVLFLRKEFQKLRGNVWHGHMMVRVKWEALTADEKDFVENLIRASIFDIVRPDEIGKYIDEGIFEDEEDVYFMFKDAETFLPHRCNDACLVKKPDGTLRCRKIDNVTASSDNTKHQFMPLPNDYSVPCLRFLEKIGLTDELDIDNDGNVINFKSSLPFFHPVRHVPPTNPTILVNP